MNGLVEKEVGGGVGDLLGSALVAETGPEIESFGSIFDRSSSSSFLSSR